MNSAWVKIILTLTIVICLVAIGLAIWAVSEVSSLKKNNVTKLESFITYIFPDYENYDY